MATTSQKMMLRGGAQSALDSEYILKGGPDQVLGCDTGCAHTTPEDGRSCHEDAPAELM